MNKKLTNEETAKIFAMYLGCDLFECKNIEGKNVIGKVTPKLINDILDDNWLGCHKMKGELLLLTPLSALSKEHAIEISKILDVPGDKVVRTEKYIYVTGCIHDNSELINNQ